MGDDVATGNRSAVLLPVAVGVWMNGQAHLSRYRTDFDKAEPKPTDSRMDEFLAADGGGFEVAAVKELLDGFPPGERPERRCRCGWVSDRER